MKLTKDLCMANVLAVLFHSVGHTQVWYQTWKWFSWKYL